MTLASDTLQFFAAFDRYMAARVIDQAGLLEHSGCQGNGSSGGTQHLAEEFVGERHAVGLHTIMAGQEPSSQALADRVQSITRGGLSRLNRIGHDVLLEMISQCSRALEFLF